MAHSAPDVFTMGLLETLEIVTFVELLGTPDDQLLGSFQFEFEEPFHEVCPLLFVTFSLTIRVKS